MPSQNVVVNLAFRKQMRLVPVLQYLKMQQEQKTFSETTKRKMIAVSVLNLSPLYVPKKSWWRFW